MLLMILTYTKRDFKALLVASIGDYLKNIKVITVIEMWKGTPHVIAKAMMSEVCSTIPIAVMT